MNGVLYAIGCCVPNDIPRMTEAVPGRDDVVITDISGDLDEGDCDDVVEKCCISDMSECQEIVDAIASSETVAVDVVMLLFIRCDVIVATACDRSVDLCSLLMM